MIPAGRDGLTHHVEDDGDEEYSSVAQHQFFKAVRKGFETEGLKIETPTKIRNMCRSPCSI